MNHMIVEIGTKHPQEAEGLRKVKTALERGLKDLEALARLENQWFAENP